MTTDNLTEQFKTLLSVNPPKSEIEKLFMKAIDSHILNYGDEEEDSYRTAKIIYHAILCEMVSHWKPLSPSNRLESEKLKLYL